MNDYKGLDSSTQRLTHPDGSPMRALVVDDEESLADLVAMSLRYEGWDVTTAHSVAQAMKAAANFSPDIAVLDIMLPDGDGLSLMKSLRGLHAGLPVLFLTAKDAVDDRVAGLTAGGDDYVTKPFSLEELVARLRGILRRSGRGVSEEDQAELRVGDLVLNEDSYEVSRGGKPIDLTSTEFELLRYLMRNPKRVLSKANILDRVWDYDFGGKASIVEIYISYLRKKIDTLGPTLIHTVRGVGYIIKPAD
jgi:two-component system, OmpR family, response regulator